MDNKRKSYTPEFKLKVVLESMQRDTTQEEVCQKFGLSSSMIHRWFVAVSAKSLLASGRHPSSTIIDGTRKRIQGTLPDDLPAFIRKDLTPHHEEKQPLYRGQNRRGRKMPSSFR
jgi:hypothetical protein